NTIVPNYITESGFTAEILGRTKVGVPASTSESFIYDREKDTILIIKTDQVPGITDPPDYLKDYPSLDSTRKKNELRNVTISRVYWNDDGTNAVVEILSEDNKDRWIM